MPHFYTKTAIRNDSRTAVVNLPYKIIAIKPPEPSLIILPSVS